MTNEIQIFNNPQFGDIRIIVNDNNEPLFCLTDVARVLCLRTSKLAQRCSEGVLSKYPLSTNGGTQYVNFINEDGFYDAILDSRKDEARSFRKWVTSEVLPAIRKTGGYLITKDESPEETMARALIIAQDTIKRQKEKLAAAETKIIEDAPYVDYADEVLGAKSDLDMIQACRVLADNGVVDYKGKPLGRTNFFKILRLNKVLMMSNRPYQKWIDKGYFGTALHTFFNGRVNKLANVPLVKPEGLKWLLEMFKTNQFDLNIVP